MNLPLWTVVLQTCVSICLFFLCCRWEKAARQSWREELQLLEWLEELGWTIGRMPDGTLHRFGKGPDPEEVRLARERGR